MKSAKPEPTKGTITNNMPSFVFQLPEEGSSSQASNKELFQPITEPGKYNVTCTFADLNPGTKEGQFYYRLALRTQQDTGIWGRVYFYEGKPATWLSTVLLAFGLATHEDAGPAELDAKLFAGKKAIITVERNAKGYLNVEAYEKA